MNFFSRVIQAFRTRPWIHFFLAFTPAIAILISKLILLFPGHSACPGFVNVASSLSWFAPIVMIFLFPTLLFIVWLFADFIRGVTRWSITFCLALTIASILPAFQLANRIRMQVMNGVGVRGLPIVEAIEKFKNVHGQWPNSLNDLAPQYLAEIPVTGLCHYPTFKYLVENEQFHLTVSTPNDGINFDELIFVGNRTSGYNPVTRLGQWEYYHE